MLKNKIQKDILSALKGKKESELKVLRFLLSQINYEEIAKQKELTDDEVESVLQKEYKKRKEAINLFQKGNRPDLVQEEENQLTVFKKYLPQQLSDKELEGIVKEITDKETDTQNIGKIIGLVMAKVKGRADGKQVSELVRQKLSTG